MLLAFHKKSYLICDEITNFRIFTQPIPNFFQSTKLRQPKQGRDSCLKINKYYIIFRNFVTFQITFHMRCQQHKNRFCEMEILKNEVHIDKGSDVLAFTIEFKPL